MLPYLYCTIPYGLSLKANLMSLIDRRGTRADQTNSPQQTPTNSLTRESRGCEKAVQCVLRALAERGARRRAASAARRHAARALRVGSSSTKMAASTRPAEELAAKKTLSS